MSDSKRLSRRRLLFAAGAGGGAAVLLAAARKEHSGQSPSAPGKSAPEGAGYRMTEHISNYYRTAKV